MRSIFAKTKEEFDENWEYIKKMARLANAIEVESTEIEPDTETI